MKGEQDDADVLPGQFCSQQCPGNYFYTCGNKQKFNDLFNIFITTKMSTR